MQKNHAKPNSPFSLAIFPTINQTQAYIREKERNAVKCMQCGYHMLNMLAIISVVHPEIVLGFVEKVYAAFS
jgi:hypothetical protein